jgi:hypothetical protein
MEEVTYNLVLFVCACLVVFQMLFYLCFGLKAIFVDVVQLVTTVFAFHGKDVNILYSSNQKIDLMG